MNPPSKFKFGTKSETLEQLRPLLQLSNILELFYFEVGAWTQSSLTIIQAIQEKFAKHTSLIIRSSATSEDSKMESMAGAFLSCLDVPTQNADLIHTAISKVIASYSSMNPKDQILIQPMLTDVAVSGVITTHLVSNGAPYYVINYDDESGKTDTVTGGIGVSKMVLIFRNAELSMIDSERVRKWLEMTQEVEKLCPQVPLDLEFAQTHANQIYLVQARRLAAEKNWPTVDHSVHQALVEAKNFVSQNSKRKASVIGRSTILGQMPDWNPAEIIGTCPRPLAISLYKKLVTDHVWREARALMGYREVQDEKLMVILGNHPYIDVRNSFNSLLPSGLNEQIAEKLIDAWLHRLNVHPELHDKVEFQIAFSVLTFDFDEEFQKRYPGLLNISELDHFKNQLKALTQKCISVKETSTLFQALKKIKNLEIQQALSLESRWGALSNLDLANQLLIECIDLGTRPFAIIARHAFIAESLLKSAVAKNIFTSERLAEIKRSWSTITGDLSEDLQKLSKQEISEETMMKKYGHLRPGTYDILSLRYDQRSDFLTRGHFTTALPSTQSQNTPLSASERMQLQRELTEIELPLTADEFLEYAQISITGREYAKFIFSKNLSDAIECLAEWGQSLDLSREDLSYLSLENIFNMHDPSLNVFEKKELLKNTVDHALLLESKYHHLRLGYLIRGEKDLHVVPVHRSMPNFITSIRTEAPIVFLTNQSEMTVDLTNKIVCIENADPGFDWVFTRRISGLITKFGGANSHMAIRCTEFCLPAAIGCGELTFEQLLGASSVELNCRDRIVRPIYG